MNTKEYLYKYCLRIADSSLILSQRMCEWCSRGPTLEEDIAISNIALDLLGQAETVYEYAATLANKPTTADELAYLRVERDYYNNVLVEQPNGDFAQTILKMAMVAIFQKIYFKQLTNSNDETLKGFASKAYKEVSYHALHASEWLIRLGNGTDESKMRCHKALQYLWKYTDDLFLSNSIDTELLSFGIAPDLNTTKELWNLEMNELLKMANLTLELSNNSIVGGCNGLHTEHLGHMLGNMQFLQRAYPGASW